MVLRASYGTLGLLGFTKVTVPSQRTAYFMLDGKCVFDCAFCTHARSAESSSSFLSRVIWKVVDPSEAAARVRNVKEVKRVCLQVVSYRGYFEDTLKVIELFKSKPVSVSVRALTLEEVEEYFKAGADRVGISIDVASPELYPQIRGGKLEKVLELLEKASDRFPGKITTHLMVGLGETEEEMVRLIQWLSDRGITVALFAFTPMKGTKMEDHPRPPLDVYRRVQVARWLIENGFSRFENMDFDEKGKIVNFGVDLRSLDVKRAFLTSGCPDCTRPYYNESPSGELYNVHDEKLLEGVEIDL